MTFDGAAVDSKFAMRNNVPIARRVLTDEVYERLKAMIMDHVIPPSAKVSIDQFARNLEVSHTPIREALARLEADGLVRKEALRGFFTTPLITAAEFEELYEFRRLLEPWAAAHAALRCSPTDPGRVNAEMTSAAEIPQGDDYESYKSLTAHDARFHRLIFDVAGNTTMSDAYERTHCHLHLFRLHYGASLGGSAVAEHAAIAAAIASRNPSRAGSAMRAHIDASYARLKEATR